MGSRKGRPARAGRSQELSTGPLPSAELLELAFHRASLVNPHGETKPERDRRRAQLKVIRASATVGRHLRLESRELRPPALGEFEAALIDRAFGAGTLGRHLLRLRRAEERIRTAARDAERSVARAGGADELGKICGQLLG